MFRNLRADIVPIDDNSLVKVGKVKQKKGVMVKRPITNNQFLHIPENKFSIGKLFFSDLTFLWFLTT